MNPTAKARKFRVDCGNLFSPQKGKCFDINGEIFVCGEVVSPTAAGIERGKIYTATENDKIPSKAKFIPRHVPDVSLLVSSSEECEFINKSDRYTVQYKEINETATSNISCQTRAGCNKADEGNESYVESPKEGDTGLSWSSLWRSFKSSATMFQPGIALSRTKMNCPQCSRKLVYQRNMITGRAFPPFCTDCKAYFVLEDNCSGDIEALRDALMEDENGDVALAFRPTEGRIIMLDEGIKSQMSSSSDTSETRNDTYVEPKLIDSSNIYNSLTNTFSCVANTNVSKEKEETFELPVMDTGISRSRILDSESNLTDETSTTKSADTKPIAYSKDSEESIMHPIVDAHLSKDIIVSSCSDTISVDMTERTDAKSVERSIFSAADYSAISDNISVYTEVERQALHQDFDFIREIASKEISKKSNEDYSMTFNCKKCGMPMMKKGSRIQCVTCPKVFLKAKEIAKTKRLCVKENLVKMHFIPRESPQYKLGVGTDAPQVLYGNENLGNFPKLFNFGSIDAYSTHTELVKGVSINGWDSDRKICDVDCGDLDASCSSRDFLREDGTLKYPSPQTNEQASQDEKSISDNGSIQNEEDITDARIENENDHKSRQNYENKYSNDRDTCNSPEELPKGLVNDIIREEVRETGEFAVDHFTNTPMHKNYHALDHPVGNEELITDDSRSLYRDGRCLEAGSFGAESYHPENFDCHQEHTEAGENSCSKIGTRHCEEVQLDIQEEAIKNISSQDEVNMRYFQQMNGYVASSESFGKSIGISFSSKDECLSIEQEPKLGTPKGNNIGSDTDSICSYGPSTPVILEQDLVCTGSLDSISILQGDEVEVNDLPSCSDSFSPPRELPRINLLESKEQCSLVRHNSDILKPELTETPQAEEANEDGSKEPYQIDTTPVSPPELNFYHSIPFSPIKTSKTECVHRKTSGGWDSDHQVTHENNELPDFCGVFTDTTSTSTVSEKDSDSPKERIISPFKDMTNKNKATNAGVVSPLNEARMNAQPLKAMPKLDYSEEHAARSQTGNGIRRLVDVERLTVLLSRLDNVRREMADIDETIERASADIPRDHHCTPRGEFV